MLQHRRSFGCLVRAALMFCFWLVVLRFEIDGWGRLRHRSRFDCRFQVFSWISVEWEVTNQGPGRLWTLEVALLTVLRSAPYILTRTSEAKHNEQQTARTTKTSDSYTSMLKGVPFGGRFYAIGLGFEGRPLDSPDHRYMYGYQWISMDIHGCPCVSIHVHGSDMDFHFAYQWTSMHIHLLSAFLALPICHVVWHSDWFIGILRATLGHALLVIKDNLKLYKCVCVCVYSWPSFNIYWSDLGSICDQSGIR